MNAFIQGEYEREYERKYEREYEGEYERRKECNLDPDSSIIDLECSGIKSSFHPPKINQENFLFCLESIKTFFLFLKSIQNVQQKKKDMINLN